MFPVLSSHLQPFYTLFCTGNLGIYLNTQTAYVRLCTKILHTHFLHKKAYGMQCAHVHWSERPIKQKIHHNGPPAGAGVLFPTGATRDQSKGTNG